MGASLSRREWNVLDAATRHAVIPHGGRQVARRLQSAGLLVLEGERMTVTPEGIDHLGYDSPALWDD